MKVLRERTFTCNGEGEYHGYEVEDEGRIFPAFTHGQMLECQRIQSEFAAKYGNDVYALLECHGYEWLEIYEDGTMYGYMPVNVDGMELYFLGANDWPWDL